MSSIQTSVSDMLVTVKTREVQRGMLAEMRGDQSATSRHLLAAAHLELVLADDYAQAGQHEMSIRSRLSAASCLWRGGDPTQAREVFATLARELPDRQPTVTQLVAELEEKYPKSA